MFTFLSLRETGTSNFQLPFLPISSGLLKIDHFPSLGGLLHSVVPEFFVSFSSWMGLENGYAAAGMVQQKPGLNVSPSNTLAFFHWTLKTSWATCNQVAPFT